MCLVPMSTDLQICITADTLQRRCGVPRDHSLAKQTRQCKEFIILAFPIVQGFAHNRHVNFHFEGVVILYSNVSLVPILLQATNAGARRRPGYEATAMLHW